MDSLLLRRRVLTLACRSESDLDSRLGTTAMATQAIMGMATRMGIIDPIRTMDTTGGLHSTGPEAIDITATIVTITTAIGIKLT